MTAPDGAHCLTGEGAPLLESLRVCLLLGAGVVDTASSRQLRDESRPGCHLRVWFGLARCLYGRAYLRLEARRLARRPLP